MTIIFSTNYVQQGSNIFKKVNQMNSQTEDGKVKGKLSLKWNSREKVIYFANGKYVCVGKLVASSAWEVRLPDSFNFCLDVCYFPWFILSIFIASVVKLSNRFLQFIL